MDEALSRAVVVKMLHFASLAQQARWDCDTTALIYFVWIRDWALHEMVAGPTSSHPAQAALGRGTAPWLGHRLCLTPHTGGHDALDEVLLSC